MISNTQKGSLLIFNGLYVGAFALFYVVNRNYEFLWYVAILVFFLFLIYATINRSKFPPFILWGLSIWGFLHMAGGGIKIGDHVLYAQHLIPILGSGESFVLKYDQAVHFFGFMMATFVVFHLLKFHLNERPNWKVIYFVGICAGMGLGALNEIAEFTPVALGFETGVGGYYNTMIDIIFNTFGAITAAAITHFRRKKNLTL